MISSADLSSSGAFQWEFKSHGTLKQFRMAGIQLFITDWELMDPAVLLQHRSQPVIFITFFFFAGTLGQISVWLRSLAEFPLKILIPLLTAPYLSGSIGSSSSCACQWSCRIPQNPAANDLEAVQHFTSVRKNPLCQALFFALQQCREERGAVAGQGVGFQVEE